MDDRERIKKLVLEGKINSGQAVLLLNALKESEGRKEKIFGQVLLQKKKREKRMWGFLSIWALAVLIFVGAYIYIGGMQSKLGRDTYKALDCFNQAGVYLEKEEYPEAIKYCRKGIEQAPRFSLGYYFLGTVYKLVYEKTKDGLIKEKAITAFQKAKASKENSNTKCGMYKAAILFTSIFLILILGAISIVVLVLYNSLVKREEQVNEAWAQIGTLYQRKIDLIPALLEAVKNYAQHEKQALESVIEARANAQHAIEDTGGVALSNQEKLKEFLESQAKVTLGLGRLFALAENYPDLKANVHSLALQQQLEETEDKIVREREIYNKRVREYNSNIRYFPLNLIAGLFRFEPKEYFRIEIDSNNK